MGVFSAQLEDAGLYNLELAKKLDGAKVEILANRIYELHKTGHLTKEGMVEKVIREADQSLALK